MDQFFYFLHWRAVDRQNEIARLQTGFFRSEPLQHLRNSGRAGFKIQLHANQSAFWKDLAARNADDSDRLRRLRDSWSDHPLPDRQFFGGPLDRLEAFGFHLQQSEIVFLIGPEQFSANFFSAGEPTSQLAFTDLAGPGEN